ncbi:MAG: serine/threonine-protein kinase [Thermoanaerobaculia bacterium]
MTTGGGEWARVKDELLAMLELTPAAGRERLRELEKESPELAVEVAALAAAADESAPFLAVPALERASAAGMPAVAAPERVGPWLLEAEIGRGGMGTVWRARRDDGAFEQTVAIKFVRPELATDPLRKRLEAERRILAGLQHECIARLLDGGLTPAGVPYLVLEYVDGEPIDAWCSHRALPLTERLRLFLDVCSAVDFAHRKLVLHRDIKSSNVLVDEHGRPKLLDFGIAKLLGPEPANEDWTALGYARPLTPEWASPEQLRGDSLTTASDVYSLGVLLCSTLTGERPHRWTGQAPDELARQIAESGGTSVTSLLRRSVSPGIDRRALRGDLERVIGRALAAEPERRYGTPAELATDLERFLDGRPVSAHPISIGYRLRKFTRRHRTGTIATAIVTASLMFATFVSLRQARIADLERARAERRFADVRRLANVVLFDVYAALDKVSGAMAARRLLVDNARRYLDDLAGEAGDEPLLLGELAAAYERVGEMQGLPEWQSEGRSSDALASFERALELRQRVRVLGEVAALDDLAEARILGRLGSILAARGDSVQALARHREALARLQPIVGRAPTTPARLELAQILVAVGDDTWELGDVPAAAAIYGEAQLAAQAAVAGDPASTAAIRQTGVVEQRLGDAAADAGDWPRAIEHQAASLAVDRQLALRLPNDIEIRRDLGTDLSRLGVSQLMRGDADEALTSHREAIRLRSALLADDPQDARAQDDLAESRYEAGKALATLERSPEARTEITAAIALRRDLVARDPDNAHWEDSLASVLAMLAEIEARGGEDGAARAALGEALAIRRHLATARPDFASNRTALADLEKRRRDPV